MEAWITANINRGMDESGLTQREVAQAVGTTEALIWRWRTGRTIPSAVFLQRLANALFHGDINELYKAPSPEAA